MGSHLSLDDGMPDVFPSNSFSWTEKYAFFKAETASLGTDGSAGGWRWTRRTGVELSVFEVG